MYWAIRLPILYESIENVIVQSTANKYSGKRSGALVCRLRSPTGLPRAKWIGVGPHLFPVSRGVG